MNRTTKVVHIIPEEFRPLIIDGKKTKYIISNYGTFINTKSGKVLKWHDDGRYYDIRISIKGKTRKFKVHRLVAMTFISNPENKKEVNHINGNKGNCDASNLEWSTPSENVIHAVMNGLKPKTVVLQIEQVHRICELVATNKYKAKEIAAMIGCSIYLVKNIKNKISWRHISKDYF